MPEKQQLVVIIIVGLEYDQLGQKPGGRPAAVQPALAGVGMPHSRDQQQKHQPDIFHIKPQPRIFQRAVPIAVDPVEMQPQHIGTVQALRQHRAGHLSQPAHAAYCCQPQPGQQHLRGTRAADQRVQPARQTKQHQRQRAVRLQQRQRQHQHGQPYPKAPLTFKCEPPQQVQRRKQHAPPEQRRPLRDEQVHNGVDPHDVLRCVVGGHRVKPGKDAFKGFGIFQKIDESESAAHKKQVKRQACLACAAQHPPRQLPEHAVHADTCGHHRQQVRGPPPGPEHPEYAGHGLAQKRVAEPMCPG